MLGVFSCSPSYFFETGSFLNPGLTVLVRLPGQESSRILQFLPLRAGVTDMHHCVWLLHECQKSELRSTCLCSKPSP